MYGRSPASNRRKQRDHVARLQWVCALHDVVTEGNRTLLQQRREFVSALRQCRECIGDGGWLAKIDIDPFIAGKTPCGSKALHANLHLNLPSDAS